MSQTKSDMAARFGSLLARPAVHALMKLLNSGNAETRIVGGAIRNTLLGLPTTDIDLATTLPPEETMARAERAGLKVVPTGIAHGTVTIIIDSTPFEVTTLRRDIETDGRHAVVAFSDSFEEDALRRDFTINQLSLSADGMVHDYSGGLSDLAARKVRFIGDPARRIHEDYLRIMRFFRFHAAYGEGALDAEGLAACEQLRSGMARLSAERIRSELMKLLLAKGVLSVMPAFVASGIWTEAAGDIAANLPSFSAAMTLFPAGDATTRLAALTVRQSHHATALDLKLKLSAAERKRLESAAKALALLGPPADLTSKAYQLAGLHLGAAAARDALGILALDLGAERAGALAALPIPVSPFKGADVLALGINAGPAVGAVIERANRLWADLGFPADATAQQTCLAKAARA